MKLFNRNIRNLIRWIIIGMIVIALGDLIIAQFEGNFTRIFTGYSGLAFFALVAVTYAVVGLPVFFFNADSDTLKIKSHFAFARFIGKKLEVRKGNIISMQVDRSGIRKKLHVRYLKAGKEHLQTFSVSLLPPSQLERLMAYSSKIEREITGKDDKPLFI